jgi:hypothetical protein
MATSQMAGIVRALHYLFMAPANVCAHASRQGRGQVAWTPQTHRSERRESLSRRDMTAYQREHSQERIHRRSAGDKSVAGTRAFYAGRCVYMYARSPAPVPSRASPRPSCMAILLCLYAIYIVYYIVYYI